MNEVFEQQNVYFGVSFKLITFSWRVRIDTLSAGLKVPKLVYRVMRRPCWYTKQQQNIEQVLHSYRVKSPKHFFAIVVYSNMAAVSTCENTPSMVCTLRSTTIYIVMEYQTLFLLKSSSYLPFNFPTIEGVRKSPTWAVSSWGCGILFMLRWGQSYIQHFITLDC